MFGIFRNKERSDRKALRLEFETVTKALHRADELTQVAVGHSINLANTAFVARFSTVERFKAMPATEKIEYIKSLSHAEEAIGQRDSHAALGFGLFKMWIGAVTANDEELATHFLEELSFFSRKGDLGG
ncbi:MAG: hypothetical protein Q7U07_06255 [Gammaproteobacteria bacterium]|nr:hypothetical protein [Gammaproteobacteria bacterium]